MVLQKYNPLTGDFDMVVKESEIDHGSIAGLTDDDHTQYLNTTRHDTTARHGSSVVDHGSIGGLADDDHTQYSGAGWNTTTTLKTCQDHIADTANPHLVTAAQIDADPMITEINTGTLTIDWARVSKTGSNLNEIATRSHTVLSDIGTNTHATIDTHIASVANPHSVTAAQVGAIADSADTVKDTHIDWGTGAGQVSLDDVPDGTSYERVAASQLSSGIYIDATTTTKGIASFSSSDFTVTAGAVAIQDSGIDHNSLTNFVAAEHFTQANITTVGTITTGTWQATAIDHERGGLEANVSTYNGLVKISGGATSAVTDNSTNWDAAYTHSQIAGGDSVHVSTTENTNWDAAYTHVSSNGTDHGYINQDLQTTASPTFVDLTISTPSNIYNLSHDSFAGFVANEHINHSSVSISAGTGLTGGGDITASRTLSLSHLGLESLSDPNADRIFFWDDSAGASAWLTVGTGLAITTTTIATNDSAIDHNSLSNTHNLTTDIDHDNLTNTHNLTTDIDHDQLTNFVANEHIDWTNASSNFLTSGTLQSGNIGVNVAPVSTRGANILLSGITSGIYYGAFSGVSAAAATGGYSSYGLYFAASSGSHSGGSIATRNIYGASGYAGSTGTDTGTANVITNLYGYDVNAYTFFMTINKASGTHTLNCFGIRASASCYPTLTAGTFVGNIYGGHFTAAGTTVGTQTAYGIWAEASGADTNYAGYFESEDFIFKLAGGAVDTEAHGGTAAGRVVIETPAGTRYLYVYSN